MVFGDAAGIIKSIIDIGAAVIKGRKQKAQLGRRDQPVRLAAVKPVVMRVIAQSRLGHFDRADAAKNVGKHLRRGVVLPLPVLRPVGHVVGVVGQQDQVIPLDRKGADHLLIKGLHRLFILEGGTPQRHQQPVLVAAGDLSGGKFHIDQVFPQCTRQGALEQRQNPLRLLLRRYGERLLKLRNNLPLLVDITCPYLCDVAFVRTKTPADLRNFFFVHRVLFLLLFHQPCSPLD